MEDSYLTTIFLTLVGFFALAVALLWPTYRFLVREGRKGEAWNRELRDRGVSAPAEGEEGRGRFLYTDAERPADQRRPLPDTGTPPGNGAA